MTAGRLRHKVSIESETVTNDAQGGIIRTWAHVFYAFASIAPIRGKEYFQSQQMQSDTSHKITLRYNSETSTITTAHRIAFDSRCFNIQSIIDINERNKIIELMCEVHYGGD